MTGWAWLMVALMVSVFVPLAVLAFALVWTKE